MSDEEDVMTPSEESPPDEQPAEKKGRGRPKKSATPKETNSSYVPSGKPRGRPKGPPKPKKTPMKRGRKPTGIAKAKPTHAPFVKLVNDAIQALQIEDKKGASKIAIVKRIMDEEPEECSDKVAVVRSVRVALKKLLAQKVIVAPKGPLGKYKLVKSESNTSVKKSERKSKGRGRPKKSEGVRTKKPKKVEGKTPKKAKSASATPKKAKSAKKAKGATKTPKGRPKKEGATPKPAYVPTGKPRGRPKKSD